MNFPVKKKKALNRIGIEQEFLGNDPDLYDWGDFFFCNVCKDKVSSANSCAQGNGLWQITVWCHGEREVALVKRLDQNRNVLDSFKPIALIDKK